MLKPAREKIAHAIEAARYMREHDIDNHHLAKTLLYLEERNRLLEQVLGCAEHYLHSGQGAREHARLVRAIEKARAAERHAEALATDHA